MIKSNLIHTNERSTKYIVLGLSLQQSKQWKQMPYIE